MIRAYIDNEEVVADKVIKIKEEMSNPSSIVLNNVFPKKWDDEKDYVSRFYFPKDYSKFRLYKSNDVSNFRIYGYCKQDGTPSPDNPKPIETFTGEQDIKVGNKTYHLSLGSLELCGIGDYKDYIYYKDNKWWKHKETEKVTLKSFNYLDSDYHNIYQYSKRVNSYRFSNTEALVISNYYQGVPFYDSWKKDFTITNLNGNLIRVMTSAQTTLASFNEYLSKNDIYAYYVLNTPIEEEITDTTLLSQLNLISDGELIFAGIVKNTGNISLNPRYPHYCEIQILDFKTFLSEGETLDFVISNKTIRQAVEMVIDTIKDYGFVVGNIDLPNADDIIGTYNCQEKTAYDVFQYIKDITQSQWSTRMLDDERVAIDFYTVDTMPRAENIEYTSEYFVKNNINDMTFKYSTDDYRNKQVVISDEVYGNVDFEESLTADGYTNSFTLQNNIGTVRKIAVNGVEKAIATATDYELGIDCDFYYTPGENKITSVDTYGVGTSLQVTYQPLVYGRQVVQNNDEINRINTSTGKKGIIARYENRNDTLSSAELNAIGQSYLKYKGVPDVTLTLTTQNKNIFELGEVAYFDAPLDELKQEYMVKSKQTQIYTTTGDIFYTYELSSSFNSENAINYFDNQRSKAKGNISAGEFITRNIDLDMNTKIIFQNLQISSTPVVYDNVLNNGFGMVFTK